MFEQERTLVRLQQRVLGEADILVCFVSGSFGRRTQDAYADLDVALVFATNARRDLAYGRRRDFAQSVLPYVPSRSFDADHVRPYFHIALYSNGSKADYRYESQETLQPNPWDKELRLLKDTDGWGEQFQAACQGAALAQPTITAAELTALDNRFWVMFWDVYRLLLRDDAHKPFPVYLQLLHFTLPPLLQALPPEDPTYSGLIEASYSDDTRGTAAAMRRLLDAYLAARDAIVKRHNLAYSPDRVFEQEIQRLLSRH